MLIEISFSEWRKWLEVCQAMGAVRVEQIVLLFRRRRRTSSWDEDNCFSMLNKVQIAFVHILLVFETKEIASCLFHAGLLTRCCFTLWTGRSWMLWCCQIRSKENR